jgi:hypothetical protein
MNRIGYFPEPLLHTSPVGHLRLVFGGIQGFVASRVGAPLYFFDSLPEGK